ncbi:hypothetical protein PACTADRAFT_51041 [Pachysolen tannophilus NRRL Y-2460]|uniref:Uncharacterized protein n=1 Tax=Pachysolen tannophilus NRRL Y-2460 TaxID=669874 RepID=A0A1E4TQZ0_PACTA|nr:hypothetical protein PACTADRAFT_51041 [Pachysolen tannophilus NRRL Y-2460]
MSIAIPLARVAVHSAPKVAVRRLGPNPFFMHAKRVVPNIIGWATGLTVFFGYPFVYKYSVNKLNHVY